MKSSIVLALLGGFLFILPIHAREPAIVAGGLSGPRNLTVASDGKIFITAMGEKDKKKSGAVYVIEEGKPKKFADGLENPRGIVTWAGWVFVVDGDRVVRVTKDGVIYVLAAAKDFPKPPMNLTEIEVDEMGNLYVADPGTKDNAGAVYRIDLERKVTYAVDPNKAKELQAPAGIVMDGFTHLLISDAKTGALIRHNLVSGKEEVLGKSFGGGLAWDKFGRLFGTDAKDGILRAFPRPGSDPVEFKGTIIRSAFRIDADSKNVLYIDKDEGALKSASARMPGFEVDETPLPLTTAQAFPDLDWAGWKPENDKGQVVPLRPVLLTHAGDGSNRVFVATEHGVIHVFPNDQKCQKTKVFLDIQDRVVYDDNQNEEGFLGLAFHPQYKKNGEFFVFYTTKKANLTNVISRFKVSKDDPDRADPASEEILLTIRKPFWNHDGGTLSFGPDGYLYLTHGDGGLANDPYGNGQNLKSLLGKVLRIDIDHKDKDKNYAIPKDNPFVDNPDARPEIYAYGLRNIWRMAFDKKTGALWAADVGQNLYEEIDLIVAGGNYGWNLREGLHPFGPKGVGPRKDLIEPIWEYHHDIGKSLTGGCVYRGARLKELEGAYLYGDYVSGKIWALRYDDAQKRVVANQPIADPKVAIMSFGEDEKGEVYFMTYSATGKGIHRFVEKPEK